MQPDDNGLTCSCKNNTVLTINGEGCVDVNECSYYAESNGS